MAGQLADRLGLVFNELLLQVLGNLEKLQNVIYIIIYSGIIYGLTICRSLSHKITCTIEISQFWAILVNKYDVTTPS